MRTLAIAGAALLLGVVVGTLAAVAFATHDDAPRKWWGLHV